MEGERGRSDPGHCPEFKYDLPFGYSLTARRALSYETIFLRGRPVSYNFRTAVSRELLVAACDLIRANCLWNEEQRLKGTYRQLLRVNRCNRYASRS